MFIGPKEQEIIRSRFESLSKPVKLLLFEAAIDCPTCADMKQLMEELTALSPHVELEVFNFHTDTDVVKAHRITRIPALVLSNDEGKDYGIRFYGIPSGYEFATLLEDIEMVSTGKTNLSQQTLDALQAIKEKVHLQVFVTPT